MTKLEAGRALDAEVAEKVMGFRWRIPRGMSDALLDSPYGIPCALRRTDGELRDSTVLPDYSTNIAAAWLVWQRLSGPVRRLALREDGGGTFTVEVWDMEEDGSWTCLAEEEADTAPLAICRAALAISDTPSAVDALRDRYVKTPEDRADLDTARAELATVPVSLPAALDERVAVVEQEQKHAG
jgi:hypothetical protein